MIPVNGTTVWGNGCIKQHSRSIDTTVLGHLQVDFIMIGSEVQSMSVVDTTMAIVTVMMHQLPCIYMWYVQLGFISQGTADLVFWQMFTPYVKVSLDQVQGHHTKFSTTDKSDEQSPLQGTRQELNDEVLSIKTFSAPAHLSSATIQLYTMGHKASIQQCQDTKRRSGLEFQFW